MEILDGDNKYDATDGGFTEKQEARKGFRFDRFPLVFPIQLRRFGIDFMTGANVKWGHRVAFPLELDVSEFLQHKVGTAVLKKEEEKSAGASGAVEGAPPVEGGDAVVPVGNAGAPPPQGDVEMGNAGAPPPQGDDHKKPNFFLGIVDAEGAVVVPPDVEMENNAGGAPVDAVPPPPQEGQKKNGPMSDSSTKRENNIESGDDKAVLSSSDDVNTATVAAAAAAQPTPPPNHLDPARTNPTTHHQSPATAAGKKNPFTTLTEQKIDETLKEEKIEEDAARQKALSNKYVLCGVLTHRGVAAGSGHYYAFCRPQMDETGESLEGWEEVFTTEALDLMSSCGKVDARRFPWGKKEEPAAPPKVSGCELPPELRTAVAPPDAQPAVNKNSEKLAAALAGFNDDESPGLLVPADQQEVLPAPPASPPNNPARDFLNRYGQWFRLNDAQVSACSSYAAVENNYGGVSEIPYDFYKAVTEGERGGNMLNFVPSPNMLGFQGNPLSVECAEILDAVNSGGIVDVAEANGRIWERSPLERVVMAIYGVFVTGGYP